MTDYGRDQDIGVVSAETLPRRITNFSEIEDNLTLIVKGQEELTEETKRIRRAQELILGQEVEEEN